MAFGWSKNRFSPIGVDFGADRLKMLQVLLGDPPQMVAAAAAELPEQTRSDPTARYAFYTESIRELLKAGGFKGRRAICSIPAYQAVVQHLQIPRVEQKDLETQVGMRLRQRLKIDPSRMVIRNFPVAQVLRDGSPKQEVICFAASREAVMQHIECAHRGKLDVVGMHCEPLVVLEAFGHLYRRADDDHRTTCFIDIGSITTKVVIAHGKKMAFAQTIHAGGYHLTRHLANRDQISMAEARQRRMQEATTETTADVTGELASATGPHGRTDRCLDQGSGALAMIEAQRVAERSTADQGGGTATAVAAPPLAHSGDKNQATYTPDTMECLIDELQLGLRYHQSIFPDRQLEKLVFVGGESRHARTCQAIARALRISAQLGDPFARLARFGHAKTPVGVDVREPQPGWAVPLGLCLSEVNC